jgi:hypothetical protein
MTEIIDLEEGEIFVFGSNAEGRHCGGAALAAKTFFGAEEGVSFGLTGRSFAIPTCYSPGVPFASVSEIKTFVDEFIQYAEEHPELTFLTTPVGTGVAGFPIGEIDDLFSEAPFNVILLWKE